MNDERHEEAGQGNQRGRILPDNSAHSTARLIRLVLTVAQKLPQYPIERLLDQHPVMLHICRQQRLLEALLRRLEAAPVTVTHQIGVDLAIAPGLGIAQPQSAMKREFLLR